MEKTGQSPEVTEGNLLKKAEILEVNETNKMSIFTKLMHMRVDLQKCGIKKTGENKYSGFMYYELADFLPQCNQIACNYNTLFLYQLEKEQATLKLINCDNPEETLMFYLPVAEVAIKGAAGIQNVGGLATYTRRYLYMIVFEVSEGDSLDPSLKNEDPPQNKSNHQQQPTPEQQKEIDDINLKLIPPVKVTMLRKKMAELGIPEDAVCERYKIAVIEDITEGLFNKVWAGIKATENQKKG